MDKSDVFVGQAVICIDNKQAECILELSASYVIQHVYPNGGIKLMSVPSKAFPKGFYRSRFETFGAIKHKYEDQNGTV